LRFFLFVEFGDRISGIMSRLFLFIGGFVGGVALRSFIDFGLTFSFLLILLGIICIVFYFFNIDARHKYRFAVFCGVLILALGVGVLRADFAFSKKGHPELEARAGESIELVGVVSAESDVRESHTKLTVSIEKILGDENVIEAESKILLSVEHYPQFSYGDEVLFHGVLEKPKNFSLGPSQDKYGRSFDYVSYLGKDDIFYQMFYPDIELITQRKGNKIRQTLFSFKQSLLGNLSRVIPEPHTSLLGGLLVGAKQAMGEELLDKFRITGVIHIVVLSGYNVTIVAEAIGRAVSFALQFLRGPTLRIASIIFSGGGIIAFALMTGAGATVIRASLMALLVLLARATGRLYEITIALFLAGFLMVLFNPKILIFDPSFQLSFLATLGLIYLAPLLERKLKLMPTKWKLREFATATLATQLFVLPLLLYMTGELSLVSLPTNLLILMFIPLTMLFGFLTALLGFVHEFVSLPFAYITFFFLEYELRVVDLFSSIPFASIYIKSLPLWLMLGMYGVYSWLLFRIVKKKG